MLMLEVAKSWVAAIMMRLVTRTIADMVKQLEDLKKFKTYVEV